MSELPTCVQCGGREFFIESGFYFCAECQIQSQDIREQVLLHDYQGGTQARTTKVASQRRSEGIDLQQGPELTSWEVLNYILKGWVDELVRLGVDAKVKIVALQLWVAYLSKLEVAFTSTVIQKKPRLGFTFRTRDAQLVYGASNSQAKLLKKPFSSSSRNSASSHVSSDLGITSRFRSKKKKELAAALYEEESVISETSRSNVSLGNLSSSSAATSKSSKMCYTVHAKKTLSKLFGSMESLPELEHKENTFKTAQISEKKSLRHLNVLSVFSILRLALLICKSPVQLSDMFRWSREGYLSLRDLERLLPPSVNVTKDIKALLVNPINSWANVTKKVHYLSGYLGVDNVTVDLLPTIEKLARELYLPDDIMDIVRRLYSMARPKLKLSPSVNYEGRAVAFIIFILKCVFSLDGQTEITNSNTALIINKGLDANSSKEKRLFSWSKWTESIEFRDAVISKYHIPSRELWHPGVDLPETIPAFLGQWSMAPKKQIITRDKEVKSSIANTLERILEPLCDEGSEPPKPSLYPSLSLVEHAATLVHPTIRRKLTSLLDSSSKYSISVYFDLERLNELADDNGCEISCDLPTKFSWIKKHRSEKMKPSHLKKLVTVSLTGDITSSDYSSDEYSFTSDIDDPQYRPRSKRKRKRLKSPKRIKNEARLSSELSYNSEDSLNKTDANQMTILPARNGNVASRIDLSEIFDEDREEFKKPVIYLTHDNYWKLAGCFSSNDITIEEFEEFARVSFAPSFLWLLQRCSKLVDQSMRDVYRQFILLEEAYTNQVSKLDFSRKGFWKKW